MEKELLNKEVEVKVAFGRGSYAGVMPIIYTGVFLESNENYYKIKLIESRKDETTETYYKSKDEIGKICYLRREFVIYIKEV